MIKPTFVLRKHEQTPLADENAGKVHGPISMHRLPLRVNTGRRAAGLEAVNLHLCRSVLVPSWLRPQWFAMAAIAVGLAAEQRITTLGRIGIEVNARARFHRRQRQLVEVQ